MLRARLLHKIRPLLQTLDGLGLYVGLCLNQLPYTVLTDT